MAKEENTKRKEKVLVLAENEHGIATVVGYTVNVTEDEYENDVHKERAEDASVLDGYDPKLSVDSSDQLYKQINYKWPK